MKKVLTLLLCTCFAVFSFAATATVNGITWTYSVSGGKATVGGGSSSPAVPKSTTGAITIPSTLGGYPVTSIGGSAFRSCSGLTSVTIPSSVTEIGAYAFYGCSSLTSVTIPSSVTSIGEFAFYGCSGLTSVTIPSSVTTIGRYAFYGCSGLTSVTIPSSVTSIGDYAFSGCSGLTSVTIPEGVTSIGDATFFACSGLTSVTIPSSVTSIGGSAFRSCSGLTSVTIPSSVTEIGSNAFYRCSGLTSVTIPSSVTSIGDSVFDSCTSLTSVTISKGVTSIGTQAFRNCSSLTSVTISKGVTSIGDEAFYGCSGLTSVTFKGVPPTVESGAFSGVASGCKGYYPSTKAAEWEAVISNGKWNGLTMEVISNPILEFLTYEIIDGEVSITECDTSASGAFEIPATIDGYPVTSIGTQAFSGCSGLTSITIPSSVTSIGDGAFNGCTALTSIVISEGVTMIGEDAFRNCGQVASFALPSTIKTIGARAFTGCERVDVADGCRFYRSEEGVLFTADNEWLLHYPKSREGSYVTPLQVHIVGEEAFMGCTGLTAVQLMDITSIEPKAFKDCNVLARCLVSDGLLTIQEQAFENAIELHYFTIPASVLSLTKTAFKNCPKLDVVSFKGNPPSVANRSSDAEGYHADETVFSGSDYDQLIGTYPIECKRAWEDTSIISSTSIWQGLKMVCDSYYDAEADGYYYQVYGGEATITGTVEPLKGDVVLPSLLGGYLVTGIGEGAFMECTEMTAVTLPASIQTLGDYAFYTCEALTTIHFEGYPLTKGLQVESPFPDDTTAIGYYPSTLKSNWSAVIQANKWYGLTMKAYGTVLRQVSAVVYGDGVVTGTGVYPNGKTVTVKAIPAEGFRFMGWDGAVVSNEAELSLTLTEDVVLKAFFVKASIVSDFVSQENAANGVVTPEKLEELRQQIEEEVFKQALEDDTLYTENEIQEMAFDTPVVEVKEDVIEIAISLQTAETLNAWQAMALQGATLEIDEAKGQVRVKVPKGDQKAAFYRFVVPTKEEAQEKE